MGIHLAECKVQLAYNVVVDLFDYAAHLGLPFQICEARKIRREDYSCGMFLVIWVYTQLDVTVVYFTALYCILL